MRRYQVVDSKNGSKSVEWKVSKEKWDDLLEFPSLEELNNAAIEQFPEIPLSQLVPVTSVYETTTGTIAGKAWLSKMPAKK